ncbi:T9SS type B sorting domain-containing protein [Lacinutrix cladophorae]
MKKITLSLLFGFMSLIGFSQVGLVENFDSGFTLPAGWTSDAEDYSVAFVENCDGRSVRANLDDSNLEAHLTSPNIVGQSNGTDLTIAFDYKIVDWAGAIEATAPGWGEILVQYSINNGALWTTIDTINDINHTTAATCFNWTTSVPSADVPNGSDFKLRINTNWAAGTYYVYLDNISVSQVVPDPPSCVNLITPTDGSTGVSVNTDLEWSSATGIPSGYILTVGTTSGGVDVVDNEFTGLSTTYDLPTLEYSTTYYVSVIPFNASGNAVGCTEYTFTTGADPSAPVDCATGTPINTVYCYTDNDTQTWNFESSDGAPLNVFFNAGQMEANNFDQVTIYDGIDNTGTVLYDDSNGGDMAGVSVIADSGFVFIEIDSDGSGSCSANNYVPLDFDVSCVDTAAVPNCNASLTAPTNGATNVDVATVITWSPASVVVTGYVVSIGTTPGGTDILDNEDLGNALSYTPANLLPYETTIYVTITPYNDNGSAVNCSENSFITELNPYQCDAVDQCVFTFTLEDTFGDGWNGNTMTVSQNGLEIEILELATGSGPLEVQIPLCDGIPFELFWNTGGAFANEVVISVSNAFDDEIFAMPSGSGGIQGTQIFSDIVNCTPPSCPRPTDLALVEVNMTNVEFSWTETGTATSWEVIVQPLGTGYPAGTEPEIIQTTDNPYIYENLDPATQYEIYVRAICGTDDLSDWEGPLNFDTTICDAIDQCVYTFVLEDTFGDGWNGNTMTVSQNNIELEILELPTGSGPLEIQVPLCDGVPFELFWNTGGAFANEVTISVLNAFDDEVFTMPSGSGGIQGTQIFSDIVNCTPPTCPRPDDLTIVTLNPDSVEIGWTETGVATTWEVIVQPLGTGYPDGTEPEIIQTTANPYLYEGLTSGVDYEIYVRAVCGTDDLSDWEGPVDFTTPASVDCATGELLNTTYCYTDNDTTEFVFASSDGSQLVVFFNAGYMESCCDELIVTDSDGTELYNDNNGGDLSGLIFVSSGNSITIAVNSDGSINCGGNANNAQWDFDVACFDANAVPNCNAEMTAPVNGDIDVAIDTDISWTPASIFVTGYTISMGTSPGATDIANNIDIGDVLTYDPGVLTNATEYFVTIVPYNDNGPAVGCIEQSFKTICIPHEVSFNAVGDCDTDPNNPDFVLEVNITDLSGSASILISDDQGSPVQTATAVGVITMGPYPANTVVTITTIKSDDDTCDVISSPITFICPPPPNPCSIIYAGEDATVNCDDTSTDLEANFHLFGQDTNTYIINGLDTCPLPSTVGGTPTSLDIDDTWSDVLDIGFEFCFFGQVYDQILVGSNGVLSFELENANTGNGWAMGAGDTLPNNTNATLAEANIFGVGHDIDPSVTGDINYLVIGSAPYRQFVVNYTDVAHFSGACNNLLSSSQIILYESSNNIDVNVFDKPLCSTWNSGRAVIGVQNIPGTVAFTPPGRNTGAWTATNESWRFAPSEGVPNYTFEWFDGATSLGNVENITVSPTETTTYTATVTYELCTGGTSTLTDEVTIEVVEDNVDTSFTMTETCDGATATIDGDTGGVFTFNPEPTDGAVIDATTGEVTAGIPGTMYTIEYSVTNICTSSSMQTITIPTGDASFTMTATCDGGTATITGDTGGTFTFNPLPTDGAIIDATTGEVTGGTSGAVYTIEYTTPGTCDTVSTQILNVLPGGNSSFTMTPTCDGATANVTGDSGGVFIFNPLPTDGAVIDATTGEITGGTPSTMYTVEYSVTGTCSSMTSQTVTVSPLEDASFTMIATCDGGTATIDGDIGGTFALNPLPTDGAVIDATTGTVTGGTPEVAYTIEYTTAGPCFESSTQMVTVLTAEDATFTMTATCDGGIATIDGDTGGTFVLNPVPTDDAIIDSVTGEITGGDYETTYTVEYTTSGACPETSSQMVTTLPADDAAFTLTATCDGATAIIDGDTGGTFAFNPLPTDSAIIDSATGEITGGDNETTYTVEYTTSGTCPTTSSQSVTTLMLDDAAFTMTATCDGGYVETVQVTGGTFAFNPLPIDGAMIDSFTGEVTGGTVGETYAIEYTTSGICPNSSIQNLTLLTDVFDFTIIGDCNGAIYELTVEPIGNSFNPSTATFALYDDMNSLLQTNVIGDNVFIIDGSLFTPPMSGSSYNYVVEVTSDSGCVESNEVLVESINCIIPQGISPNNDGKNDSFDLTGYDVSRLEIFNRHGIKVYSKRSYTNEWYGQSDAGDELPVGTYFYKMEYQGNKTRTSWIYLNREN